MVIRCTNSSLIVASVVIALAACGDDASTGPASFDPADLAQNIGSIERAISQPTPVVNAYLILANHFAPALPAAAAPKLAAEPARLPPSLRSRSRGPLALPEMRAAVSPMYHNSLAAPGVVIPEEVRGTTFEWNSATGRYEPGTRTGAPLNGVRFILYSVDPATRRPAVPLMETGHVDLIDVSTATTDALRVEVVAAGRTHLDYSISLAISSTTTSTSTAILEFEGSLLAEDDVTIDVGVDATIVFDPSTGFTESEAFESRVAVPSSQFSVVVAASLTTTSTTQTLTLTIDIQSGNTTIRVVGGGDFESATFDVSVNGRPFATIVEDEFGNIEVFDVNGDPLDPTEADALLESIIFSASAAERLLPLFLEPVAAHFNT